MKERCLIFFAIYSKQNRMSKLKDMLLLGGRKIFSVDQTPPSLDFASIPLHPSMPKLYITLTVHNTDKGDGWETKEGWEHKILRQIGA